MIGDPGDLGSSLRWRGKSKDRRDDLPQVEDGLAVTRAGILIRCWCWPGNTVDMSAIQRAKKDLVGWKLGRAISVFDPGFASEENLRYLQRAGGHCIAGEPMRRGVEKAEEALSRAGRYSRIKYNLDMIVGSRVATGADTCNGHPRISYTLQLAPLSGLPRRQLIPLLLDGNGYLALL